MSYTAFHDTNRSRSSLSISSDRDPRICVIENLNLMEESNSDIHKLRLEQS